MKFIFEELQRMWCDYLSECNVTISSYSERVAKNENLEITKNNIPTQHVALFCLPTKHIVLYYYCQFSHYTFVQTILGFLKDQSLKLIKSKIEFITWKLNEASIYWRKTEPFLLQKIHHQQMHHQQKKLKTVKLLLNLFILDTTIYVLYTMPKKAFGDLISHMQYISMTLKMKLSLGTILLFLGIWHHFKSLYPSIALVQQH